jgi:hypothetical protein
MTLRSRSTARLSYSSTRRAFSTVAERRASLPCDARSILVDYQTALDEAEIALHEHNETNKARRHARK